MLIFLASAIVTRSLPLFHLPPTPTGQVLRGARSAAATSSSPTPDIRSRSVPTPTRRPSRPPSRPHVPRSRAPPAHRVRMTMESRPRGPARPPRGGANRRAHPIILSSDSTTPSFLPWPGVVRHGWKMRTVERRR